MLTTERRMVHLAGLLLSLVISSLAIPVSNSTEEVTSTTAAPVASPKIETGFKPSVPVESNNTEAVKKRHGRYTNRYSPVRKFDKNSNNNAADVAVPGDYPVASVVNHYHGDLENGSLQAINYYPAVQPEDTRLEKPPRLYYGDYTRRPAASSTAGIDYMEADDGKANDYDQMQLYYYPKNLLKRPTMQEHTPGNKQGRPHGSGTYNSYSSTSNEDQRNQPGQTQLHGQISVSAGLDAHPFPHHHHLHHGGFHNVYRDHGHDHQQYHHVNPIGPVIGRALQLLIPSALLITGASALFPNRVHVPTNDAPAQQRNKRSVERVYTYGARPAFDEIPSQYLRPEHRSDDEGIELYDDEEHEDEEAVVFAPSSTTSFGERMPSDSTYATPMPVAINVTSVEPTSALPIIKINKLVPVEDIESEEVEIVDQEIKKLNSTSTTNTTEPQVSPMEVMSKLLMASVSTPSPATLKKPANTDPTKATYSSVVPQIRRYDTSITSHEKPIFRPLSTEASKIVIVTPVTNAVSDDNDEDTKTVKRRQTGKENPTSDSSQSGPPVIELGGESAIINGTALNRTEADNEISDNQIDIDLSPDSPVVGLLTNYAAREEETPACQKRALCELAIRGSKEGATKFERFLWNLANLVPPKLSVYYDLQDTFMAIQRSQCTTFVCANPNLDLQLPHSEKS